MKVRAHRAPAKPAFRQARKPATAMQLYSAVHTGPKTQAGGSRTAWRDSDTGRGPPER
jgi:hypothetical protein